MKPLLRAALFLLMALPAAASGFRWDPDLGWVEDFSIRQTAFPTNADELAAAGYFNAAALRYYQIAMASSEDLGVRRLALLKMADAQLADSNWSDAYDTYDVYALYAETHHERTRAKRSQVDACVMGVRDGLGFDFFGTVRGSRWAGSHGKDILNAYAYEDWSAPARLRFAQALLQAGRFQEAVFEYEWLLTDFPDSPFTPTARYRKGEALLSEYQGIKYDPQPLLDANREFQRYLDDYPEGDKVAAAEVHLDEIQEQRAERDWDVYKRYRHLDNWRSARLYLKQIIRRYPNSPWAAKAREALPEAETEVARLPLQDREKK